MIIFTLLSKTSLKVSYKFLFSVGYEGIVSYNRETEEWKVESVTHFYPDIEFVSHEQFKLKRALSLCFPKKDCFPEETIYGYC